MNYGFALLWYSFWIVIILASYLAAKYAIIYFDKKWKDLTEKEQEAADQEKTLSRS
ncbi:MAG: hypothetical protein GXY94_11130 [Bacteroidales bacterium]|jgi:hypothetical protein|nr:hypothetical protein [Bacteroidales bacterium]